LIHRGLHSLPFWTLLIPVSHFSSDPRRPSPPLALFSLKKGTNRHYLSFADIYLWT
jgi:hypothetical protein